MARKSRKNLVSVSVQEVQGMKVWKTALYIRLSVEFNGKRGDSLETQQQIMEAHAAMLPDIQIVEKYTDNGTTGRTFDRPAFQKLLEDVEAGKIDCIMVKDLSRLGRNTIDTGYYIEKYFPIHKVRFISVNDQFDSMDKDNSGSYIILPLKNMINEAYAADISKKVKTQLHQGMKDGDFIGARPPYGYKKSPDNCHKLIVNTETAPIVCRIFDWASQGIALNEIVKRLNEDSILTPGYYAASCGIITHEKLMGSGAWQTRTVSKILADAVYVGDMVQGKTKVSGRKQVLTDPESWVVVHDTHEPLINRDLFNKVQKIREQASKRGITSIKNPYTENVLRSKIFCGYCGKNLHRQRSHDRYLFHCISNDRIAKGACIGVSAMEDKLFDVILTIIRKQAETIIGRNLCLKQADTRLAAQKTETESQIIKLRQEAASSKGFLKSLYESLVTGVLTSEEYRSMKVAYERKIQSSMEHIQLLSEKQADLERQVSDYASLADKLAQIHGNTELTAKLVELLIEQITVNSDYDISIQFRFETGFERIDEVLAHE